MKIGRTLKCGLLITAFLILVGWVITSSMTEVRAGPGFLFTLYLSIEGSVDIEGWLHADPFEGEIAEAIKTELAKIGINVQIHVVPVAGAWPWLVEEPPWLGDKWNLTYDQGGWDMGIFEFWWMPTDLLWFEYCYVNGSQPPIGWNIFGWQNARADKLLHLGMTTLDKAQRKQYIDMWQEEYMHDPPAPVMYYPILYEVTDANLEGWDYNLWWADTSRLHFKDTTLEDNVTLRYGINEDLWYTNPMFMANEAQEALSCLIYDTLMKKSKDWETGQYIVVPSLARNYPVYSEDGKTVTVYLRENVTWHDGVKFTSKDVKFTFDALLDEATGSWAYSDFAPVIESVEIIDDYTVVFHLYEPYAAFNTLLANTWGGFIIPEHILRDVPHSSWKIHPTNYDPSLLPGTGPYKFVKWVIDDYWKVDVNKDYFLGENMIDHIIFLVWGWSIPDEVHLGNFWTATMDEIEEMMLDPTLKVLPTPICAGTHVGFNLHHPILSNRYVRQAIAHAIPYHHIINNVLPTRTSVWSDLKWSRAQSGIPATAPVTPTHGWLYNTDLQPYEHNITKAQQYMDMWYYSQVDIDYTKGPVGDTDFSGFVELPDFYIWVKNFGKAPDQWPWSPGNDIDPDFDNNGLVEMDDFYMWTEAWGKHYPFEGAR